jgi:hypothetical protein
VFYERRPRPERTSARAAKKIPGPKLFAGIGKAGYHLGDRIYSAVGEQLPFKIEYERPNQGDLDIKVELATTKPVSIEDISPVANDIATSAIVYANLSLGELIAPIRRLHVCSVVKGKKSKFSYQVGVHTLQRPIVTIESAVATMSGFETFRRTAGDELARAISVASRRYISALTEVDEIDRYCDLWEACEISTFDIRAPGGIVGRIAKALAHHLLQSNSANDKARVETRIGLKDLYDARGNLVHTAIDQPRSFAEKTNLLESVTSELLRYRLGLPPDKRSLACKRGTAATPDTVNHRDRR